MLPFAIAAGYMLYQMFFNYEYQWSYWLVIPVIAIAASLALYPQLDAIGYKLWPQKLDPTLKRILLNSAPSTKWIEPEDHDAFFAGCLNEIRKMEFIGMQVEDIPTDIEAMCIYPALLMEYLFGIELTKEYSRVALYKHPFPSPQYNKWHSGEVNHEDGVVIMNLNHIIPNYSKPGTFYNIPMDLWTRALLKQAPHLIDKDMMDSEIDWGKNDLKLEEARKYLGLDIVLQRHLNWQAFFNYPDLFRQKMPEAYQSLLDKIEENRALSIEPA